MLLYTSVKWTNENNKEESTIYYTIHITRLRNLEEALRILSRVKQLESTTERWEGWLEEAHIVHTHWRERETNQQIYSTNYKEKN